MKRISLGTLMLALFIPLVVGAASAALTARQMAAYGSMSKPPLSPPAWVFSVAWTILYIIMGLASYFVFTSENQDKSRTSALFLYMLQLVMNFMWSIIFFGWTMYMLAFIWLLIMWGIVIICAFCFFSIKKTAGYLMIPYILWLTFAAYLNLGAYLLSRGSK